MPTNGQNNIKTKRIIVEVSAMEAAMLKRLRRYPFGKFTIHKQDGQPVRTEINSNELLEADEGLDLAVSKYAE